MKGNNEGEDGGVSIASRRACTGRGVLPAQSGARAVAVGLAGEFDPWRRSGRGWQRVAEARGMSLASRRDEADVGVAGPQRETCAWRMDGAAGQKQQQQQQREREAVSARETGQDGR